MLVTCVASHHQVDEEWNFAGSIRPPHRVNGDQEVLRIFEHLQHLLLQNCSQGSCVCSLVISKNILQEALNLHLLFFPYPFLLKKGKKCMIHFLGGDAWWLVANHYIAHRKKKDFFSRLRKREVLTMLRSFEKFFHCNANAAPLGPCLPPLYTSEKAS